MSEVGERAPGGRRARRREPLRAAPEPVAAVAAPAETPHETPAAMSTETSTAMSDETRAGRRWRDRAGALASLALVAVASATVLVAASADPGTDPADDARVVLRPVDVTARTETSAPRVETASAGAAQPADAGDDDPLVPGGDLDALVSDDGVPSTGGYTDLIRSYFGALTVEAIVIVQCESGFDPTAVGTNTNGTQDHGLFQINDVHRETFEAVIGQPWSSIYDPTLNTAFAAWLHGHAGGWGPWRCNRNLEAFQADADPGAENGADEPPTD